MWKCSIEDMLARSGGMFSFCAPECDLRKSTPGSDRGAAGLTWLLVCEVFSSACESIGRIESLCDATFAENRVMIIKGTAAGRHKAHAQQKRKNIAPNRSAENERSGKDVSPRELGNAPLTVESLVPLGPVCAKVVGTGT